MGRKNSRRQSPDAGLTITSMMDMMTIILVFLLKSYQTDDVSVAPSEDLQIPLSSAEKTPKLAVNVVVSRKDIVVDGVFVLDIERGISDDTGEEELSIPADEKRGQLISKLFDVLLEKAQTAKDIGARAGTDEMDFKGEILLQVDKRMPFSVVREVMFTAGQAQFGNFRFVVIKGGSG
ncbi:MAG: biopolymer transporter ExbD [Myxococcales bacterium]|nr:biopolymer transporter ExbD [Myxococcales bacterium]